MKILQLIDTLSAGGAERMSVNIANALTDNGIDNALVVTHHSGPMVAHLNVQTSLHILNKRSALDVVAFYHLIKIILAYRPTHIHAHSTSIAWAVLLKIVCIDVKLIWHDHFGLNPQQLARNYMTILFPFINTIIVVKEELVSWAYTINKQVQVFYLANFAMVNLPQIPKVQNTILCLANIRRQKDIINLIEAAYIMRSEEKSFHIRIVGNTSDQVYLAEINKVIEVKHMTTYVTIVGTVTDVGVELAKAQIGVLSSLSEGLPVSLIEYGLAGLPIVVTDVGQCGAVVGNGKYGKLVPPANPALLADALLALMNNPIEAQEMGKQFKQHVLANYGAKGFINKYLTYIQS
jgi:glycosyltransferase involved in cell wall biosynthesis